jgi:hypothetical protein
MDGYGTEGRRQSQSTGFFDYNGIWGELKVNIDSAEKLTIDIEVVGDNGNIQIDILTGEMKVRTKKNLLGKLNFYRQFNPMQVGQECMSQYLHFWIPFIQEYQVLQMP